MRKKSPRVKSSRDYRLGEKMSQREEFQKLEIEKNENLIYSDYKNYRMREMSSREKSPRRSFRVPEITDGERRVPQRRVPEITD